MHAALPGLRTLWMLSRRRSCSGLVGTRTRRACSACASATGRRAAYVPAKRSSCAAASGSCRLAGALQNQ